MLISSPRHRPEDLRLWAELEDADKAFGKSLALHRKVGRSIAAIRRFVERGPCYAAISFGKDSVVLAGLIREAGIKIPCVWIKVEPIFNPDCLTVRDALSLDPYLEVASRCQQDTDGWHASGTLERGIAEAQSELKTKRCLLGIRADESGARKLSAFVHGQETETRCRPLLFWTGRDVFAYLASRSLPVHPAYAMLGGGRWTRERIRVASLSGRRGDGMGRAQWEQEYYGDYMNRLRHGGLAS